MTDSSNVAEAFERRPGVSSLDGAIVFGVSAAGACYAALWLIGANLLEIVSVGLLNSEFVFVRVFFAPFFVGLGALCGLLFGCLSLLLVTAFLASVKRETSYADRGGIIGGLAGYFAMASTTIAQNPSFEWQLFLVRFSFAATAAALGTIGGALGARKFLIENNQPNSDVTTENRYQFGVREIFVVIVWACALLATMRLLGLLAGPTAIITVVLGIVIQPAIWAFLTRLPGLRNKLALRLQIDEGFR